MENMAVLWNSKDFGPTRVASLRAEQMVAPEPPALVARTQLEDMHVQIPIADGVDAPSWIDGICANRGIFQHCALFFQKNGEEVAFAFVYAVQQPRSVSLLVLEQVDEDLPHLPSGCSVWGFAQSRNDYEFVVCRRYAREVDVKADEGSAIMVLLGLFFRSGDRMALCQGTIGFVVARAAYSVKIECRANELEDGARVCLGGQVGALPLAEPAQGGRAADSDGRYGERGEGAQRTDGWRRPA